MNEIIQLIIITLIIIFIYNKLSQKDDRFQSTSNNGASNESMDNNFKLNNPKLESIQRFINDKQKLLEDVNHRNCKLTDDGIQIINNIKQLKEEKNKLEKKSEYEKQLQKLQHKNNKNNNKSNKNEKKIETQIMNIDMEIQKVKTDIETANNKLDNRYCPQLLKATSDNNMKTTSFLDNVFNYQNSSIINLNKNIGDYRNFSDNYSISNEASISDSLEFINPYLQMKSFNDNASSLEMMQDTTEFSNEVPPIVPDNEMIRLYPFNFTDFNGNYSINLGNFNHKIIDNRHTVKIQINTNEDITLEDAKALNLSNSGARTINNSDLEYNPKGNLKIFDANGDTLMNFDILNIAHAELPEFPTTTIFISIKSVNIYQDSNKSYTTEELTLKLKKIKLLKYLGLKDGGLYLHGNDGQFNLYNFNKLLILNMSPI